MMPYLILIGFVCGLSLIFFFAWKKNYTASLTGILVLSFFLRLSLSTDNYLHNWDERFHAVVAKNTMEAPLHPKLYKETPLPYDYKDWTGNHVWLAKPILPIWALAGSFRLLGVNNLALHTPVLLLSLLSVFLTFLIGNTLWNKKVGTLAAFFHGIHGLHMDLTAGLVSSDVVDVLFLFFFQLAFLFILKEIKKPSLKNLLFIGIFTACAFLSKWIVAIFIPMIFFFYCLSSKQGVLETIKKTSIICIIAIIFSAPWVSYILVAFPLEAKWILQVIFAPIGEPIQGHQESQLYYFDAIRIIFSELIYLPLLWLLYTAFKHKQKENILLLVWIFTVIILLSIAGTKRLTYLMVIAPAMFVLSASFIHYLQEQNYRTKAQNYLKGLVILLLIALPIRYSLERIKPFKARFNTPEWKVKIEQMATISVGDEKLVISNDPHYLNTMFYTDFIAYPFALDSLQQDQVHSLGYRIVDYDSIKTLEK